MGTPINSPGAGSSTDPLPPALLPSADPSLGTATVPLAQADLVADLIGDTQTDQLEPAYQAGYAGAWQQNLAELDYRGITSAKAREIRHFLHG